MNDDSSSIPASNASPEAAMGEPGLVVFGDCELVNHNTHADGDSLIAGAK